MTPAKRRSGGIALDSDSLRFATGAAASAEKAPASARPAAKAAATRSTSKARTAPTDPPPPAAAPTQTQAPTPPAAPNPDALEGELFPGEERIKIGSVLPATLKSQVDGAVRYSQDTGEIPGLESQADFIRIACHRLVEELKKKYNDGRDFTPPRINRRGRIPGR